MLKVKFIDKILEVMQDEADRIWVDSKEVTVYFKDSRDVDGNAEILKLIYSLKLNKIVENYRIKIDYEFKNIEIHKGTKFVCLRNFNSCNGKIWTAILEEIAEDKEKMEEK
ncbi:Phage protein [Fusobacterium sp. oral taxon C10]